MFIPTKHTLVNHQPTSANNLRFDCRAWRPLQRVPTDSNRIKEHFHIHFHSPQDMAGHQIVPRLNRVSSTTLSEDIEQSKKMIMEWLPRVVKQIYEDYEGDVGTNLKSNDWTMELWEILQKNPLVINYLRALCIRYIGRLQFADFSGFKSDSKFKRLENDGDVSFTADECKLMSKLLKLELNPDWTLWILEQREPLSHELEMATQIVGLRMMDRDIGTQIRYRHEPRQLKKLKNYFSEKGLIEINSRDIDDPRNMPPGTFTCGCTLESLQENSEILLNPVDVIVMPLTDANVLPIFIEAKSMTDKANPNKRQKEEGKKIQNLRKRWKRSDDDPFIYVLLIGGTIPKRYLQTEENQGIDWIFEDRPADLDPLLEWYGAL